jgi:CHAT domain-containing protein
MRGEGLAPLPGTELELRAIHVLLTQKQWRVVEVSKENALKTRLLGVKSPRALHLATHGFFLAEPGGASGSTSRESPAMDDPMLRAGLFFAGANRTLSGEPSAPGLDDGILTAYEATGLNLHGTELVVLSACETGLGQTKSGEGVFGLRRAFQEAGAESLMMSMWSVPDRETKELMARFYRKWLAGKEKHLALREAQLEMREVVRKRYGVDFPFYWGAFVLVGR